MFGIPARAAKENDAEMKNLKVASKKWKVLNKERRSSIFVAGRVSKDSHIAQQKMRGKQWKHRIVVDALMAEKSPVDGRQLKQILFCLFNALCLSA